MITTGEAIKIEYRAKQFAPMIISIKTYWPCSWTDSRGGGQVFFWKYGLVCPVRSWPNDIVTLALTGTSTKVWLPRLQLIFLNPWIVSPERISLISLTKVSQTLLVFIYKYLPAFVALSGNICGLSTFILIGKCQTHYNWVRMLDEQSAAVLVRTSSTLEQCTTKPIRGMAAFRIDAILGKNSPKKCVGKGENSLSDFKQTTSPYITEGGGWIALRHCSLFIMFVFLANLNKPTA